MMRRFTLLIALAMLGLIVYALLGSGVHVPERAVLVIDLSGSIAERPPIDWVERLRAHGPALPTLLLQLEKAKKDPRIAAVMLRIEGVDAGFSLVQELRNGLRDFAAQKPLVAWLDLATLNATREIYLASTARMGKLYVAPGLLAPVAGVAGQALFLKGLLDKVGVSIETERIGKYKSATEMFTEGTMSQPARQQLNELLDGVYGELVSGIAEGRKLDPAAVRKLIDAAPGTADEWQKAGLADDTALKSEVLEKAGLGDLEEISLATYADVDPAELELRNGPRIAVVFAEGTIVPGGAGVDSNFTPERIGKALDAAAEDEDIRAIVLRINSGGGSSQASEAIWQRVVAARKKKPVIVSMGDAAASGGYYVACGATAIVAQPTTLTGSIGVFFLRPSFGTLLERLAVKTETFSRGQMAGLAAADHRLTEPERERMRSLVADQYKLFLERIASGRPLKTEEIDAVGQGRVWLGSRALEIKLVDALGGLSKAVELAKEKAGIPADVDPQRVVLPAPQTLGDELRGLAGGSSFAQLAGRMAAELPGFPTWLGASAALLEGAVYLPSVWVELY